MRFLIISTLAVLALTACTIDPPRIATGVRVPGTAEIANADYGAYPANYDAIIRSWFAARSHDPRSVRFGPITKPIKEHIINRRRPIYGYAVCAEVDAKNRAGAQTGMRRQWFFLRNHVVRRVRQPRGEIYIGRPYRCEETAAEIN